jgi:hypothetical protein
MAVEPVLMFRASCYCGWWQIVDDEELGKSAVIQHRLNTRCDGCGRDVDHGEAEAIADCFAGDDTTGVFCPDCAPDYRRQG